MSKDIRTDQQKHSTPLPPREGQGGGPAGGGSPLLPILQVGDVLLSPDILTEYFCCDYEKCKGVCCIEGEAGAPVSLDEIAEIEDSLDVVRGDLTPSAQRVIDEQGVAYPDPEGELVTSIVNGKECVFAKSEVRGTRCEVRGDGEVRGEGSSDPCWLCMLEKAYREGRTTFMKPISCSLYPIREKQFSNGTIGLNYHRWAICRDAIKKGQELNLPVYQFLREPLIRRFGQEWYDDLCQLAKDIGL